MDKEKKIIITGGHLSPALAIIPKLKKEGWQILFVGRKHALEGDSVLSFEYKVIKKKGIEFFSLYSGRLQRSLTFYTIPSLFKIPVGFFQSFYLLIFKFRPQVILSFGGYLALPICFAGWILKIPIITHEQSVIPGLATKIIGKFAKKICISWQETAKWFPKEKIVFTGNPLRKEVFLKNIKSPFSLSFKIPLIYITGGSLGSHTINEVILKILPTLLKKYQIIHQCGDSAFKDYEKLLELVRKLPSNLKKRYFLTKYVSLKNIGWILDKADLIISRAGANTVCELAALGKPAILIPLPWVGQNEQMENARLLEKAGTAIILPQDKLTGENLYQCIESLIQNINFFRAHKKEGQKLINLNAEKNLLRVIEIIYKESL